MHSNGKLKGWDVGTARRGHRVGFVPVYPSAELVAGTWQVLTTE